MKKHKIHLVVTILLVISTKVFAKQFETWEPTFHGTIKSANNEKTGFDSLTIKYKKPYTPAGSDYEYIRIVTDKDGHFNFKLPKSRDNYMFLILIRHKNSYIKLNEHFFSEPTDNIKIDLIKGNDSDLAQFYGKGAEKYNIANDLYQLDVLFRRERMQTREFYNDPIKRLETDNKLYSIFARRKEQIIDSSALGIKMQKLFTYENCRIYHYWQNMIYYVYNKYKKDPQLRKVIVDIFNKKKQEFSYKIDPLMSFCPLSLEMAATEQAIDLIINSKSDTIKLESFYNKLKSNQPKIIREIMITNLFTSYKGLINEIRFNDLTFDSLLRDAQQEVKTISLKQQLIDRQRKARGEKLFSASFVGIDGQTINTSDLKGKVVLIDLWNVGCSWCAVFHEHFTKNIYPLLKGNKNFIYLSISTDKTKERWKKGIESGLYTSKEYLNVNTGPLGINHPFTQYYNVTSLPFGLLIDKNGNIYSNHITDPDTVLQLINSAITQTDLIQ